MILLPGIAKYAQNALTGQEPTTVEEEEERRLREKNESSVLSDAVSLYSQGAEDAEVDEILKQRYGYGINQTKAPENYRQYIKEQFKERESLYTPVKDHVFEVVQALKQQGAPPQDAQEIAQKRYEEMASKIAWKPEPYTRWLGKKEYASRGLQPPGPYDEMFQQFVENAANTATFGFLKPIMKELGYEMMPPTTHEGEFGAGTGSIVGLFGGPFGGPSGVARAGLQKAVPKLFAPIESSIVHDIGRNVLKEVAIVPTMMNLGTLGDMAVNEKEAGEMFLNNTLSGAEVGGVFGALKMAPHFLLRLGGMLAYRQAMHGENPFDDRPIYQRSRDFTLDLLSLYRGELPAPVRKAMIENNVDVVKRYLDRHRMALETQDKPAPTIGEPELRDRPPAFRTASYFDKDPYGGIPKGTPEEVEGVEGEIFKDPGQPGSSGIVNLETPPFGEPPPVKLSPETFPVKAGQMPPDIAPTPPEPAVLPGTPEQPYLREKVKETQITEPEYTEAPWNEIYKDITEMGMNGESPEKILDAIQAQATKYNLKPGEVQEIKDTIKDMGIKLSMNGDLSALIDMLKPLKKSRVVQLVNRAVNNVDNYLKLKVYDAKIEKLKEATASGPVSPARIANVEASVLASFSDPEAKTIHEMAQKVFAENPDVTAEQLTSIIQSQIGAIMKSQGVERTYADATSGKLSHKNQAYLHLYNMERDVKRLAQAQEAELYYTQQERDEFARKVRITGEQEALLKAAEKEADLHAHSILSMLGESKEYLVSLAQGTDYVPRTKKLGTKSETPLDMDEILSWSLTPRSAQVASEAIRNAILNHEASATSLLATLDRSSKDLKQTTRNYLNKYGGNVTEAMQRVRKAIVMAEAERQGIKPIDKGGNPTIDLHMGLNPAVAFSPEFRAIRPFMIGSLYGVEPDDDGGLRFDAARGLIGAGLLGGYTRIPIGGKTLSKRLLERLEGASEWAFTKPGLEWFHPRGGVPADIWKLRGDKAIFETRFKAWVRDNSNQLLKNFNQDERVLISDHIEQEGNFAKASQKVKDQAEVLRKWHSAIGKELVDLGMLTPEQYAKWDKMYLHRVYDPTLQQKIASVRKKAWDALIGKYTMNRGVNLGLPVHAGNKNWNKGDTIVKLQMIDAKGNVHTNFMEKGQYQKSQANSPQSPWSVTHEFLYRGTKGGKQRLWRDYSYQERQAMGENRDAVIRFDTYGQMIAHDLALGRMFESISQNPNYFSKTNPGGDWIHIPDTRVGGSEGTFRYGKLHGGYVHPDVMKTIHSVLPPWRNTGSKGWNQMFDAYQNFLGAWKTGMTSLNYNVWMNNTMSNVFITMLDGREPTHIMAKGLHSLGTRDKFFDFAKKYGLIDSDLLSAEIPGLQRALTALTSQKPGQNPMTAILDSLYKGGKGFVKWHVNAYQLQDRIFKVGLIRDMMEKGATPREAIAKANELYFDYRDVPIGVQAIRDFGYLPFITYTYKALPVIAKSLVEHPHRALAVWATWQMMNDIAFSQLYHEDRKKGEQFERELLYSYQKGIHEYIDRPSDKIPWALKRVVRVPYTEEQYKKGFARYLQIGNMVPMGNIWDVYPNIEGGIPWPDVLGGTPLGQNPLVTAIVSAVVNRHLYFGKPIMQSPELGLTDVENAKNMTQMLARTFMPNNPFFPGSWSFERVGNALTASGALPKSVSDVMEWTGKDFKGRPVDIPAALLGTVGVKIRDIDMPNRIISKYRENAQRIEQARNEYRSAARTMQHEAVQQRLLKRLMKQTDIVTEKNRRLEELERVRRQYER